MDSKKNREIYLIRKNNIEFIIKNKFNEKESAFAKAINKPLSQVCNWLSDKTTKPVGAKLAAHIETMLNLEKGSLDHPITDSKTENPNQEINCLPEIVYIPVLGFTKSEITGYISFEAMQSSDFPMPLNYLKLYEMSADNAKICLMPGNGMEPRLFNNDYILINTARRLLTDNKIYAVIYNNEFYIKRIIKNVDGSVTLFSDNRARAFEDKIISKEQINRLIIIGQAIVLVRGTIPQFP